MFEFNFEKVISNASPHDKQFLADLKCKLYYFLGGKKKAIPF